MVKRKSDSLEVAFTVSFMLLIILIIVAIFLVMVILYQQDRINTLETLNNYHVDATILFCEMSKTEADIIQLLDPEVFESMNGAAPVLEKDCNTWIIKEIAE